jgi:hypothetical protein
MKKSAIVLLAIALFTVVSYTRAVASPASRTFTGSGQSNVSSEKGVILKASATFTISNDVDLIIALSNISTNAPKTTSDILTGLFFDISTNLTLTPRSATVAPGSKVVGPVLNYDGDVSGQWAYTNNLPTGTSSKDAPGEYGLSDTKYSFFKKRDLFSHSKLPHTSPLSGVQFGITDMSEFAAKAQGSIKHADLILYTIDLVLNGLPVNFTLDDITGCTFVFGTSAKQGKGIDISGEVVGQLPEPSTVALVAMGLLGALALVRSGARRR